MRSPPSVRRLRSATIGSTAVARRAGTKHASRRDETEHGRHDEVRRRVRRRRLVEQARAEPRQREAPRRRRARGPAATRRIPWRRTIRSDAAGQRAEGHADAELLPALADREADDAGDPGRRDDQREAGEERRAGSRSAAGMSRAPACTSSSVRNRSTGCSGPIACTASRTVRVQARRVRRRAQRGTSSRGPGYWSDREVDLVDRRVGDGRTGARRRRRRRSSSQSTSPGESAVDADPPCRSDPRPARRARAIVWLMTATCGASVAVGVGRARGRAAPERRSS